MIEESARGNR